MKNRAEIIQKYRKLFYTIVVVGHIFFGCFTFPFVNLTRQWPINISIINIVTSLVAYYYIGLAEAVVFQKKSSFMILLLNLGLVCLGLGCRYLLEFGEVSNSYNFTFPNIILHLAIAVLYCTIVWLWRCQHE